MSDECGALGPEAAWREFVEEAVPAGVSRNTLLLLRWAFMAASVSAFCEMVKLSSQADLRFPDDPAGRSKWLSEQVGVWAKEAHDGCLQTNPVFVRKVPGRDCGKSRLN